MEKEIKGLLAAAQYQAISTRWRPKHIEKQMETLMCRLRRENEVTTFLILCEYSKIASTQYKKSMMIQLTLYTEIKLGSTDSKQLKSGMTTRQKQCWETKKQR